MLDDAFDALKKYDWGTDKAALAPIEEAVTATHGKPDARKDLENRLLAALNSDISRDAKDYVCRKLTIVGTAASAPTLAGLLGDKNHAHMARYALERIPAPEAARALREALPKLSGNLKIGAIGSIGARRDAAAVPALGGLLTDSDASVARAAAVALGDIGTAEAAKALQEAAVQKSGPSAAETRQAVIDAQLACAEALLADDKEADARAIYKSLGSDHQSKLVRLAATRGILACASKKA
jgi:HEAT repeat protein